MFVSFPTFKPSPCKRFLTILNRKERHYSTNSHRVFDSIIDITIVPKNVRYSDVPRFVEWWLHNGFISSKLVIFNFLYLGFLVDTMFYIIKAASNT